MKINDKIIFLASDEEGIIVATKEIPKIDLCCGNKQFPINDFIIMLKNKSDGLKDSYLGLIDVCRNEIELIPIAQ